MNAADVVAALQLPAVAWVGQRVPKKLLVENGAPTAADKRQINDGIDELQCLATLIPTAIGIPAFSDGNREYVEIAILSLTLRAGAKAPRLTELIHRAIPYPLLLIQTRTEGLTLSLANLRRSQGQVGQTVLEDSPITATVETESPASIAFLASLHFARQPQSQLYAFYQGWIEKFEAFAAAQVTGRFVPALDSGSAERRRLALAEHDRLTREITSLRARAAKETQINRRVELNLEIKRLETHVQQTILGL